MAATVPTLTTTFRRITERAGHVRAFAALARRLAPLDALLFKHSSGRLTILGPQGAGMPPTLLLTTTGRRTGKSRTTPVMYLTTDSGLAITSESFGQARPASWPQNLDADPRATAQIDDRARRSGGSPILGLVAHRDCVADRDGAEVHSRSDIVESPEFRSARLGYRAAVADSSASLRAVALSGSV